MLFSFNSMNHIYTREPWLTRAVVDWLIIFHVHGAVHGVVDVTVAGRARERDVASRSWRS